MILLQYQPDILAQGTILVVLQVDAVKGNNPAIRFIELAKKVNQGALSGTTQPHDSSRLSFLQGQAHLRECLLPVGIGEVHVVYLEPPLHVPRFHGSVYFYRPVVVKYLEEAVRVNERVVYLVVYPVQLADGGRHVAEKHDMHHDGTNAHLPVKHEKDGKDNDEHHPDLLDKRLQALEHVTRPAGLQLVLQHLYLHAVLFFSFHFLADEALDHGDGIDDVNEPVVLPFALAS